MERASLSEASSIQTILQKFEVSLAKKLDQQTHLLGSTPTSTSEEAEALAKAEVGLAPPAAKPSSMRRSGPTASTEPHCSEKKAPPSAGPRPPAKPARPPPAAVPEREPVPMPPGELLPLTVPK